MSLPKTKHASVRMQQRGISQEMVAALIDCGRTRYTNGAWITDMDKGGLDSYLNRQDAVNKQLLEKLRKTYLVEIDGHLVTAAIKDKRFKRKA